MNGLILYYIGSNLFTVILLALYVRGDLSIKLFIVLILVEAFIYRPLIDYLRLRKLKLVEKKDFKKMFGAFRFKFYKELLMGK